MYRIVGSDKPKISIRNNKIYFLLRYIIPENYKPVNNEDLVGFRISHAFEGNNVVRKPSTIFSFNGFSHDHKN